MRKQNFIKLFQSDLLTKTAGPAGLGWPNWPCMLASNYETATEPAPIKDTASIQKLFFEHIHYSTFYSKSFTCDK